MNADLTSRPRNGTHHGDVSYITLRLPDLERGRSFYGSVLGWTFSSGSNEHGAQVDGVVPMLGLWDGDQPAGGRATGAVLGYRVDDIDAAVAAVRAHGGTVDDPHREPYAMAAEGCDDQGLPFYLHELPPVPEDAGSGGASAGVEGDVSYLTVVVRDIDAAERFYRGVFGWTFDTGATGAQVGGVAPLMGLTTETEPAPTTSGAILCYRADDIAAAVERVRAAGGQAEAVAGRPYGLESRCMDDQGIPFYLHQF